MKKKESPKQIQLICDECTHSFVLSSDNIHKQELNVKGDEITLTFFLCPKCNKLYKVSVTDQRYDELKADVDGVGKKIKLNIGKKDVNKGTGLQTMIQKKNQRLRDYACKLDREYPGTFTALASINNQLEIIYHEQTMDIKGEN